MNEICFSKADTDLILSGKKIVARFPMDTQPPKEFCSGDVAGITNGQQWAISISSLDSRGPKAWPPGREPGFECPYGGKEDVVRIAGSDVEIKINRVDLQLLHQITLHEICDEGLADDAYQFRPAQDGFRVFSEHWDRQYGSGSYEKNPWVWVLEFEVLSKH